MSSLDACQEQYLKDLANQTHCCAVKHINDEFKDANRKVFQQLVLYQKDIEARGTLPFELNSKDDKKSQHKSAAPAYPESLSIRDPRQLKQILPIPDIHKVSDCDLIYRFLLARRMDVHLATTDILHYIAFREKYSLDTILWDREVESIFNGLDGEELVQQVMTEMRKNSTPADKVKITRPLLQAGWAAWNCGVDRRGHVVFYQRPNPKELAMLEKRWPFVESQYDCRNPDFHSVTLPYTNLLSRLYLRQLEKGRRISRLLNYNQQHIIRKCLHVQTGAKPLSADTFMENGGGATCLVDVGCVKVSHLTSSKFKKALKLFRLLSLMGQSFYPENMSQMIIVNGGFVFKMLFKLIRPWLDPQTQQKILLLSATNKATPADFSSDSNNTPLDQATRQRDDSEEDEAPPVVSGSEKVADLALRDALAEYIHEDFIPSWYGGHLTAISSPLFYGGSPPKKLSEDPHYAAACKRLHTHVMPELLPDEFIFTNAQEGKAVSQEEWKAFCTLMEETLSRK
ncbi:hypothetical protein JKF63_06096 [Porcisia hertigi]|uniref:CRAL-TRIO domain-containing protein n=1 Tax=Porcisia hertigi TaxID=2761500 RepID=A0A836ITQ4_9TRYP|nr:hypothetical protein JKF63_06096 [Porcisia hertigi]